MSGLWACGARGEVAIGRPIQAGLLSLRRRRTGDSTTQVTWTDVVGALAATGAAIGTVASLWFLAIAQKQQRAEARQASRDAEPELSVDVTRMRIAVPGYNYVLRVRKILVRLEIPCELVNRPGRDYSLTFRNVD